MHIFSFVLSIIAISLCWIPFWSVPIALLSLIISLVVMNKFFFNNAKEQPKKVKGLVFSSFVLTCLAFIGALIMSGIPTAIFLLSY